ncbi:MAG: phosphate regulon sensor histidine kinase PhoR [Chromatiales bacterium]|nr:phosphate regulon sensor histidine kinase PhoR [Chromatiales bacterium]MDX9766016.1 phosphate regulon sensor histidine kinase PhoR [Ectothiorhodospiraceae bacterium]
MYKAWTVEIWRLIGALLTGLVIGLFTEAYAWSLLFTLLLYIGWQFYQLYRFHRWLLTGRRSEPPPASGVWGELMYEHYRLHMRNRKRKKKVARLLRRFTDTSAAMPDAAVILDRHFQIEWFNDAAGRLLGLKPQDVGRRITHLLRHPAFIAYVTGEDYRETVEFPGPLDIDLRLNARIVPYGDKQYLLSVRDVTRLYRLEEMRRDFVANVSHELRTPLTVITGYLETLTDMDEVEPVRPLMVQVKSQAERMRRIVEDLLALARLETRNLNPADMQEVPVPALVAGIAEDARVLSGERQQTIVTEVDADLRLRGAPSELHSAFANLVSNAVRYTQDGGRIVVRWYADDAGAHFEVEDNGIGIEPQHLPRLTERFYRVESDRSRASGGTGLGLAIVKHVLQRHGASLRIDSQPGRGSRFTCDFPPDMVVPGGGTVRAAGG